jgi:WD40 repeat protein
MRLGSEGDFQEIRLSPDVEQVATTTKDGRVLLWDTATASIRNTLSDDELGPFGGGLGFSRDNSHLVLCTRPRDVQIRDRASGEVLADLHLPFEVSAPLVFLPDGKLVAAAGHDGTVQLAEWATGEQKATVHESSLAVHHLDVSQSGATIVWCDVDGWLRAWATDSGRLLATTKIGSRAQCLAISDDDQFVVTAHDENKIAIWELGTLQHVEDLVGPTIGINVLAFCPDGKTLAAGDAAGSVVLWDWVTKQQLITLIPGKTDGAPEPITALKFSSDGRTLAAVTGGSEPRVFRCSAPREIR